MDHLLFSDFCPSFQAPPESSAQSPDRCVGRIVRNIRDTRPRLISLDKHRRKTERERKAEKNGTDNRVTNWTAFA